MRPQQTKRHRPHHGMPYYYLPAHLYSVQSSTWLELCTNNTSMILPTWRNSLARQDPNFPQRLAATASQTRGGGGSVGEISKGRKGVATTHRQQKQKQQQQQQRHSRGREGHGFSRGKTGQASGAFGPGDAVWVSRRRRGGVGASGAGDEEDEVRTVREGSLPNGLWAPMHYSQAFETELTG